MFRRNTSRRRSRVIGTSVTSTRPVAGHLPVSRESSFDPDVTHLRVAPMLMMR